MTHSSKLSFGSSSPETCACGRRSGCKWFKCGQPGPHEHAYKCELFYATAGNLVDDPVKLHHLKLLVAHVLGYASGPPHVFGTCGKLWTLAALQYRLRDGAMSCSFAILLLPRPVPPQVIPTLQKIARTEKPYAPHSHRLFDTNPFSGLGVGRPDAERKLELSYLSKAVWAAHASWLARASLGRVVNWGLWQFAHVAAPPSYLLRIDPAQHVRPTLLPSSTMRDLVTATPMPKRDWVIVTRPSTSSRSYSDAMPGTDEASEELSDSSGPSTPPLVHPRPKSFAGFTCWDGTEGGRGSVNSTCEAALSSASAAPTCARTDHRKSYSGDVQLARVAYRSRPSILMFQNDVGDEPPFPLTQQESTYYLANDDTVSVRDSDYDAPLPHGHPWSAGTA